MRFEIPLSVFPFLFLVAFSLGQHKFSDIRIHVICSRGKFYFPFFTLLYCLKFSYHVLLNTKCFCILL